MRTTARWIGTHTRRKGQQVTVPGPLSTPTGPFAIQNMPAGIATHVSGFPAERGQRFIAVIFSVGLACTFLLALF